MQTHGQLLDTGTAAGLLQCMLGALLQQVGVGLRNSVTGQSNFSKGATPAISSSIRLDVQLFWNHHKFLAGRQEGATASAPHWRDRGVKSER